MSSFDAHPSAGDTGKPAVPKNENTMTVQPTDDDTTEFKKETKRLWVITGPAGCGKTTVAEHLAKDLDLPYIEGDQVYCARATTRMNPQELTLRRYSVPPSGEH